jgi:cephalosporin-C deacetylase-like acetyl esterase
MGILQTTAQDKKFENNQTKELRNKAYTLGFNSLREFRKAGKLLYRKATGKLKAYLGFMN